MTYCNRWHDKTTNESAGLKCPYCGYLELNAYEIFYGFDEDGQEIKCGTVLDPFAGSGTTAAVAASLGMSAIAIEINPDYCKLIRERVQKIQPPIRELTA